MEIEQAPQQVQPIQTEVNVLKITGACVAGALVPGLGHALLQKWDRAMVFFGSICLLFAIGLQYQARLSSPEFSDLFSSLKFIADAGSGLLYWISWLRGLGAGDP